MKVVSKKLVGMGVMAALLSGLSVQAGGQLGGNGGDVLRVNGKYCMLDLVEAGVCDTMQPKLDEWIALFNRMNVPGAKMKLYQTYLIQSEESPINVLPFSPELKNAIKSLFMRMSEFNSAIVASALMSYTWKFTDAPLVNIGDEDTFVDTLSNPLVQVAIRSGNEIFINENVFKEMDLANQLALVTHEVLYAVTKPVKVEEKKFAQLSRTARGQNGRWFKEINESIFNGLTSLGWQEDIETGNSLFALPSDTLYSPVFKVVHAYTQEGLKNRIVFPNDVIVFADQESESNKASFLSAHSNSDIGYGFLEVVDYAKEIIYGRVCKDLVAKKSKKGILALNAFYTDVKFSKVLGTQSYAMEFKRPIQHLTNQSRGDGVLRIYSIEFPAETMDQCMTELDVALGSLREKSIKFFSGI